MLWRLIAVSALAVGMSIAAAVTLATPALAKGPTQASITGPGLTHPVVVSGDGEPGQLGRLATLAGQTSLFSVMFPAGNGLPAPVRVRTPLPRASLGPRYTVIYTVPGVTPKPGEQFGRVREDLYPFAADGPVIYTPPGQAGFGGPLQVTGWFRASHQLTRTLTQLGVPPAHVPPGGRPTAGHQAGSAALAWLIAALAAAAAAVTGIALWLRHRRPATA
ncbi:MAG TPA: hypothetical protein VGS19_34480 [Streptosporangiaceae bacterium]|nr:hypothetical protein [Streptosporangiaceae bacterium]